MRYRSLQVCFWCFIFLMGIGMISAMNQVNNRELPAGNSLEIQASEIKIGLAEYDYDPIDSILDDIGLNYTWFSWYSGGTYTYHLENITAMREFDIIFLPCGGEAAFASATAINNIRQYVQEGGVIYGSDWADDVMTRAFPGKITYVSPVSQDGIDGWSNNSFIQDDALRTFLGKSYIDIYYDLDVWAVIDSVSSDVSVLIKGDVDTYSHGSLTNKPLAVRFTYGCGTVIYTTFHNEAQVSEDAVKVLEYYIQSLHGYTLLCDIYQAMGQGGQMILSFVGNLTQGGSMYCNLSAATIALLQSLGGTVDIFLNWQGSVFNFLINDTYYGGAKPYKVTLPISSLASTNITVYANETVGAEFCIAAFIVYISGNGGNGGIPGFEYLFSAFGIVALIIIYSQKHKLSLKK